MLVKELFAKSLVRLEEKSILFPRYSIERLMAGMLNCMPKDVYLYFDKGIDPEKFNNLVEQRLLGKPVEYILQSASFCDLDLLITEDVLIPRQETELLVELIAKDLGKEDLKGKILLDLCTGSGCIGIALKKRFPDLEVILSDICPKALAVAKTNATKNKVEVSAICGDFLEPLSGLKANYIVSNPPYISLDEYSLLSKEVKDFEPQKALIAENEGLYFYEQVKNKAHLFLNPKGKVFFEIGYLQKISLQKLFSDCSFFIKKEFLKDLSGKDRFFFLEIE